MLMTTGSISETSSQPMPERTTMTDKESLQLGDKVRINHGSWEGEIAYITHDYENKFQVLTKSGNRAWYTPTQLELHTPNAPVAKRYNTGKLDYTLLPQDALDAETKVWQLGLDKYGRNNWEKLWGDDTVNVVLASLLRHAFAIRRGEFIDAESGEQHAAHIRCNSAMLIRHYNEHYTK